MESVHTPDHPAALADGREATARALDRTARRTLVLKVLVTVGVLAAAVGFLIYSSIDAGASYYLHVNEVMKNEPKWVGKPLQLHGRVAPGSIVSRLDGQTIDRTFVEQWSGAEMKVHFRGIVPDTFKDNAEVVAKGRILPGGVFEAEEITAKCPSKYQGAGQSS